jgi:hypothetical protein
VHSCCNIRQPCIQRSTSSAMDMCFTHAQRETNARAHAELNWFALTDVTCCLQMRRKDGRMIGRDGFPVCSVLSCQVSLMGCRVYNQRCYICPAHQRAAEVLQGDSYMRFCHQCGRLHALEEFSGSQRSCTASLNRRRKVLEVRSTFAVGADPQHGLCTTYTNSGNTCSCVPPYSTR